MTDLIKLKNQAFYTSEDQNLTLDRIIERFSLKNSLQYKISSIFFDKTNTNTINISCTSPGSEHDLHIQNIVCTFYAHTHRNEFTTLDQLFHS